VGDGRKARGKRYEWASLLVVVVLAKLAGMQSLLGASEWIADQQEFLRTHVPLCWKRMPCANTYRSALALLESQPVNALLAAWCVRQEAASRCGEEPSRLVAQPSERHVHLVIDGQALRGTGKQIPTGEEPPKQVLPLSEVQTGIVLQQCPIAQAHHAVRTLKPLLTEVLCKGRILTADAAQSYHEFGRLVQRAGGEVIVVVKGNTPATQADLALCFEDEQADRRTWQSWEQVEKGHGRLERRSITITPDLNDYLRQDWGEVGLVFRVQRERTWQGRHSVEVIYGWSSLSPRRCSPQRLLRLMRAHWAVENRLHWRRDVTLGEDRCGVRFPPVAQMLAVLNTVVLSLMDRHQVANLARQIRRFSSHPDEALAWVCNF
jgi:DDE_Tnp_1-associated/Transposase DDE domain